MRIYKALKKQQSIGAGTNHNRYTGHLYNPAHTYLYWWWTLITNQKLGQWHQSDIVHCVYRSSCVYSYPASWASQPTGCFVNNEYRPISSDIFWCTTFEAKANKFCPQKQHPLLDASCTLSKDLIRRINAFELRWYRRMLKIGHKGRVLYVELQWMKEKLQHFRRTIRKTKMAFAGHVLWESSGDSAMILLEGKMHGKRCKECRVLVSVTLKLKFLEELVTAVNVYCWHAYVISNITSL